MRLKLRLLCIALLAAAGCADSPSEAWEGKDYRYDFMKVCRCITPLRTPVTIFVHDGRVVHVVNRTTGQSVANTAEEPFPTIEDLIEEIARARRNGLKVTVRYDEELDYPTYIELGTIADDSGFAYTAENLQYGTFQK
jgi:hypothetical protein